MQPDICFVLFCKIQVWGKLTGFSKAYFYDSQFSCYREAKTKYGNVLNAEANVKLQVSPTASGVKLCEP